VFALPGGLAFGAIYQWIGGSFALGLSAALVLLLGLWGAVLGRRAT
jgi:hypothetical protein